ncbi:MAG: hypothetical protein H7256_04885 [Bdellovibrio sp.]|nr:hypothetical protein [Bdellovibrio sp.]
MKSKHFKPLTDDELKKAFVLWYRNYNLKNLDQEILPFLKKDLVAFDGDNKPNAGWLEKCRNAQFFSTKTVADKLKVTRAAYTDYEDCERKGTISLNTLAKAAEAMDCELVYAIRPKNHLSFSAGIWKKILPQAILHPWIKACDPKQRARAVFAIATRLMKSAEFKKSQGWSQRANKKSPLLQVGFL